MSIVWTEPCTSIAPPSKKRKNTLPEHSHTNEVWAEKRARITELFEDNELPEVAATMAEEGFEASIPQFRYWLKKWKHWKYLKLSEKQWRYIGQKLMQRRDTGKEKTAFKLNGKKIPSSRLEKDLLKMSGEDTFDLASLKSAISVSDCEISAYTSSTTKGVRLRELELKGIKLMEYSNLPSIAGDELPEAPREENEQGPNMELLRRLLLDTQQRLSETIEELHQTKKLVDAGKETTQVVEARQDSPPELGPPTNASEVYALHAYYSQIIAAKDTVIKQLLSQTNQVIAESAAPINNTPPEAPEPPPFESESSAGGGPLATYTATSWPDRAPFNPVTQVIERILSDCFSTCIAEKYPCGDSLHFFEGENYNWMIHCNDCGPDLQGFIDLSALSYVERAENILENPFTSIPSLSEHGELDAAIKHQLSLFEKSHLSHADHREKVLSRVFGQTRRTADGFICAGAAYDSRGRRLNKDQDTNNDPAGCKQDVFSLEIDQDSSSLSEADMDNSEDWSCDMEVLDPDPIGVAIPGPATREGYIFMEDLDPAIDNSEISFPTEDCIEHSDVLSLGDIFDEQLWDAAEASGCSSTNIQSPGNYAQQERRDNRNE